MNRFTKDLGTIDELLPETLFSTVSNFLLMFGIVTVVIASNLYLGIPASGFLVVLWLIRNFYLKSSRDLKRIEAAGRRQYGYKLNHIMPVQ
jgi:ATP-binding cassette subfamily C (CFTR/MRP) protein 4